MIRITNPMPARSTSGSCVLPSLGHGSLVSVAFPGIIIHDKIMTMPPAGKTKVQNTFKKA